MRRLTYFFVTLLTATAAFAQNPAPGGQPRTASVNTQPRVDVTNMPRPIDMHDSVWIEDLTMLEVRDLIKSGKTTALILTGGIEENGPYLTTGKHNNVLKATGESIARALGNALVAPVIAYVPEGGVDPPTSHMRFPGTISIPSAAFEATLEGAARSLRRAGFRDIVLLGDHGGYAKSLAAVATRLNRAWSGAGTRVLVPPEYYRAADQVFAAKLLASGYRADEIGTHAGLADTSLTLAVAPSLVRADEMHAAPSAAQGVYGDPRRSSAALGEIAANAIVADTVAAIRSATAHR